MPIIQGEEEVSELVSYKTRKRVAKKVLKDIHQQMDDIEQQVQAERQSTEVLIPLLLLLAGIIISLSVFWTQLLRMLSGLIG